MNLSTVEDVEGACATVRPHPYLRQGRVSARSPEVAGQVADGLDELDGATVLLRHRNRVLQFVG